MLFSDGQYYELEQLQSALVDLIQTTVQCRVVDFRAFEDFRDAVILWNYAQDRLDLGYRGQRVPLLLHLFRVQVQSIEIGLYLVAGLNREVPSFHSLLYPLKEGFR